jgi:HSP20 family protein
MTRSPSRAKRRREQLEQHEGYYRSERSDGSFNRVVPRPAGAITDQAKAVVRDGVLEITMPAPPASRGRRLQIGEGPKK